MVRALRAPCAWPPLTSDVRSQMFRYLHKWRLSFSLRGLNSHDRDVILNAFSNISEREAFELLFLPGRTIRRIARDDPQVLKSVLTVLAESRQDGEPGNKS